MKTLQNKQLALLNETVAYYSEDTNRRCDTEHICAYDPATVGKEGISEGCAIGRLLSPQLKKELDKKYTSISKPSGVPSIFEELPKSVQYYGKDFLTQLQSLHDQPIYWDHNALSVVGKRVIESFKECFGLTK